LAERKREIGKENNSIRKNGIALDVALRAPENRNRLKAEDWSAREGIGWLS